MSLKDEHLRDARVVGEGGFALDRARAMEKLAKFQLEDPHAYVLELVAAAVCAGSTEVVVQNDADDLELGWDGDHPTEAELDALFDHIFYRGMEPRRRMLQHLAQGIYGALGLQPRWIRLERPGLTLDLTDPLAVKAAPNAREAGVFVHVRERLSWKVLWEAVSPFDQVQESKLLRARALLAPLPILIHGADITAPARRPGPPKDGRAIRTAEGGPLWLAGPRERLDVRLGEGVLLVRDGVVVQAIAVQAGPARLAGWVEVPQLQLNASRSAVVEDEAWRTLRACLSGALAELLAEALARSPDDAALREGALALLQQDRSLLPALEARTLFADALDRRYAPRDLQAASEIWTVPDLALVEPGVEVPLFVLPEASSGERTAAQAVLWALYSAKMRDASAILKARAEGRARRQALARRDHPLRFGEAAVLLEHAFERGGAVGVVGIPREERSAGFRVELRVGGLPVEEITLSLGGVGSLPLVARLSGEALRADAAFRSVVDDAARKAAVRVLLEETEVLLVEAALRLPHHEAVRSLLLSWLEVLAGKGEVDLDPWIRSLPEPLARAPLFPALSGGARCLRELPGAAVPFLKERHEDEVVAMARGLPPAEVAALRLERVLVLRPRERRILRRALGHALKEQGDEIALRIRAAWRRSQPPQAPALPPGAEHQAAFSAGDLSGLVGLMTRSAPAAAQVLHQGVDLGWLPLACTLPGVVASVSWGAARSSADWSGLAEPDAQAAHLTAQLWPHITALLREALAAFPPQRRPLPPWLPAALQPPCEEVLLHTPFFPTVGGALRSLAALKEADPVEYVLEAPPPIAAGMAALAEVLVLDSALLALLSPHIPKQRLRDVARRVRDLARSHERFLQQPVLPLALSAEGRWVGRRPLRLSDPDIYGEMGIRLDGSDAPMLRVRCQYEGRVLETLVEAHFLRVWVVITGRGIQPDDKLGALRDSHLKLAIRKACAEAAQDMIREVVADPRADDEVHLAVLERLVRRQQVPGLEGTKARKEAQEALRHRPLFATLGGEPASLAAVEAAHAERRLRVVAAAEARQPPPGGGLWLAAGEVERHVLRAVLGRTLPEGRQELEEWQAARQRRLLLNPEPDVPAGPFLASWLVRTEARTLWLGLSESREAGLRLDWRIDGVIIATDTLPAPIALRARLSDAALQPDAAFRRPLPGPALEAAQQALAEALRAFMLALACELSLAPLPPAPGSRPAFRADSREEIRARVLAWSAKEDLSDPAWAEPVFLQAADGRGLSLPALQALAGRGPLRVVPPGTRGRTIDPDRPAVICSEPLRRALERCGSGPLEDFTARLAEEDLIVARRSAPPVIPPPRTDEAVLLTHRLPAASGREGFVQVTRGGENGVGLHAGWRALDRLSPAGPVPLVGEVSDPGLAPDDEHRRALADRGRKDLQRFLEGLSAELLPQVLEKADVTRDRALLVRVLSRAFADRQAVRKAEGTLGRLARLPLFRTGSGEARSAFDLASARHPPRFAPLGTPAPSVDPERPFTAILPEEHSLLAPILGGTWEAEAVAAERAIIERRTAPPLPHALPSGERWLARAEATAEGARILAGLSDRLAPGRLEIRSQGTPVHEASFEAAGLVAVVDVPPAQVDAAWQAAKLTPAQRRELSRVHQELLQQALPGLREALPRAFLSAVAADPALRALPLLRLATAGEDFTSLEALTAAPLIVRADVSVPAEDRPPGAAVLAPAAGLGELLVVAGLGEKLVVASRWLPEARRQREEQARVRAAEARARAEAALHGALQQHMGVLTTDLPEARTLRTAAIAEDSRRSVLYDAALADPEGPAGRLLAVWLLDSVCNPEQRRVLGPELWTRLAEHL